MLLALSVVSEQGGELGSAAYKVFDERGGSIGRIAGNDWVLPDPQNFVSSRHARVSLVEGRFYLEDTSSNGTFINEPDRPTARGRPQLLNDGDRLYIGDYEIIVQIIRDEPESSLGLGTVDPLAALANKNKDIERQAVQAGLCAGFNSMLDRLDPHKLEEINANREAYFQFLFGEAFALAYNEHLQKLTTEARLRKQR